MTIADHQEYGSRHREYLDELAKLTLPKKAEGPVVLDLFAGCGGLSMGFEVLGFRTIGYEMESDYVESYTLNYNGECHEIKLTDEFQFPDADIVIGGPPCQPFSVGGDQRGLADSRDGFPIFIEAVRQVNPSICIVENVRGLLYRNRWYLEEIAEALKDLGYFVEARLIKLANHGVPQNRERVFMVAHRGSFDFPAEDNDVFTVGDALGELALQSDANSRWLTPSMDAYVARYEKASKCATPRDTHLHKPARTLTCRNIAASTGDMHRIVLPNGKRRMLTVREAARLQTFPDWFKFCGNQQSQFYQIGNAVPPLFSLALATQVQKYLDEDVLSAEEVIQSEFRQVDDNGSLRLVRERATGVSYSTIVDFDSKSDEVNKLQNEALNILRDLGMPLTRVWPTARRLEKAAMCFLAVAKVKKSKDWCNATDSDNEDWGPTTREIIDFINSNFEEDISSGSYDDIRRKDLAPAVVAGIVLNQSDISDEASTNTPTRGYRLNPQIASVARLWGTEDYGIALDELKSQAVSFSEQIERRRSMNKIPVTLSNGEVLILDRDEHNQLQAEIIEEFLPRFGQGSEVLYVGDTSNRLLYMDSEKLADLGVPEPSHDELPDVVAYTEEKNWIFLIEAVHSSGAIDEIRRIKLLKMLENCKADPVFVTAFANRTSSKRFLTDIAWETEVWFADTPDHMMHLNGDKFVGPYD